MSRYEGKVLTMEWRDYIHADPNILVGKPIVKGTRLSVAFLLALYADGWSEQQVLESYPTLSPDALKAVFAYAAECVADQALFTLPAEPR